jgi:hypothetical protein
MVDQVTIRRGGKSYAKHLVRLYVRSLTGRTADLGGHAKGVFYAVGITALTDIQDAYLIKARGGTDACGIKWPPLSKAYLAYQRRFGPGEQAALKRAAGLKPHHYHGVQGNGGLLSKAQQKRWYQLYGGNLAWLSARVEESKAKNIAAAMAWTKIKEEGAKTKLEVFGSRIVDILMDTDTLYNSLSPGYLSGTVYTPKAEAEDNQVFTALSDGIIIGTNLIYARTHNQGDPKRGIPKREFLPSDPPMEWLNRWAKVAIEAIAEGLANSIQEARQ